MIPALIAGGIAAASLASNLYAQDQDRQSRRDARKYLSGEATAAANQYNAMMKDIKDYYATRGSLGQASDRNAYRKAMAAYDPEKFAYTPKEFNAADYGVGSREDYINPYYDQIIGDMTAQVQHSAAGAGLGRGSGAAQAIAKAVAEKDNELWKEANQEYKDERNFAYSQYNDYVRNMQSMLDAKRAATDTKLTMQGNLAQDYYNVMDSRQADLLRAQQDKLGTQASYSTAMAGLY